MPFFPSASAEPNQYCRDLRTTDVPDLGRHFWKVWLAGKANPPLGVEACDPQCIGMSRALTKSALRV